MPPQEASIRAYRRIAPIYYWIFGWMFEHGRRKLGREISRLSPASILEIGVGTGMALRHYPAACCIHGVDVSEAMLGHAYTNTQRLPHRSITLSLMDGESLSFPEDSFDCVTLPYVLSVTDNPLALLREARRVCKPEGYILVINHFSKPGVWQSLQHIAKWLGTASGFKTGLSYDATIGTQDWNVIVNRSVNLFNISNFLLIKNAKKV